ncbi:ferrous iron transporter B [Derxia gummosa]|uniref:Fe(2+) transporter FeoB n=1 Tax=Derxia gummosa DSM 723 TaxID=1121388 RepID=A0A8B6X757_9BURK|nr:ferrous iron transporter B [Derxia gummosa]
MNASVNPAVLLGGSAPPNRVALIGNPNCGKTALFNQLTGSRQKVANYAGATVERKEGRLTSPSGREIAVLDLPGAYSLAAASPDEEVTRDFCLGKLPGETRPDMIISVVDATNLRLHLRFVLELKSLGLPMVVALNMMDAAARRGIKVDRAGLERELGLPVIETVAVRHDGARALLEQLDSVMPPVPAPGPDADATHAEVMRILAETVVIPRRTAETDDLIDRWALHPVWGPVILAAVLFLMFQAVFSWAAPFQDGIDAGIQWLGGVVGDAMPEGALRSLLVDGVIAGAGSVLVFLPQILFLFLFILALEESGYLPRAAFLLDRVMLSAGLTGRSFIPLLSSFACAVPGIMATRSIQDPRDRLATILVAPLMTCSARLPVYALLIGAFIPDRAVGGVFNLQGIVLFGLYAFGIVSALAVAWVTRRLRGKFSEDPAEHALLLELPSYRLPRLRDLAIGLSERASIFLRRVGGVILALTVLLWFLSSFPAPPEGFEGAAIDASYAGRLGRAMEPLFAPIGFNWQICIALVPGMAAREVAVGALATVYALSATADDQAQQLAPILAANWSLATALAMLVWYVFAPQCLSTLAVIRRETNSWRWVAITAAYLFGLAWLASFVTYRLASAFA